MRKNIWKTLVCMLLATPGLLTVNARDLRVLQFNIWQEGTVIEGGFDAVADEIIRSDADFVTLSEVRNYHGTRFCDRITEALQKRGQTYYSFYSDDSGLLSRYPITDSLTVYPLNDDRGSMYKLLTRVDGHEIAVYTAHLDYRNCAYYDARGYDGNDWHKLDRPVADVEELLRLNRLSVRDDAVKCFLREAEKDREAGRLVLLGGDFNEPSHLDWNEATRNLRDHRGMAVPWDVSSMLEKAGYRDTYREKYPDPVTHPGFTCPADCPHVGVEKLAWAPDADERDRIDYIFYRPDSRLELTDVVLVGPKGDILRNRRVTEQTHDKIVEPQGVWPTDHKAVLATFRLK